jgi:pantoate--beta-alanine ligase
MGALHAGHVSLVERSVLENDRTVVSIFVNPTQFNDSSDLEKYPVNLDADVMRLTDLDVDVVYCPTYESLYPDVYRYKVSESDLSTSLCGASRPGHFDGVLTVVMRLLNIVKPTRAYFGEKDYQQYLLVQGMVSAFAMDVEIVPCPIVRDENGVALSSRNLLLDASGMEQAAEFAAALRDGNDATAIKADLEERGIKVDYVVERDGRRFGAVFVGGARLIDNVPLD